ncbi:5-oxoprolinase/urea amidolyase family protein [Gulosibacter sp. 10]|uniref:5-oxoprolinase subunit B/C family protein n=1 Tax=Gulosibacter sp. 10 TaxID=1255570 RepID=UPI00097E9372|nr:5-oxoprolinase/urea amidolyase family protein [Gulosibacter sp. 10]SJM61109.1 Allophanate hydrolase 2 subunit 1 [Gulosibacter sp. 10]
MSGRGESAGAPAVRAVGEDALLLDCGSLERALAVFGALEAVREAGGLGEAELVPAAETVLVRGGAARHPGRFASALGRWLAEAADGSRPRDAQEETVLPVVYDGADLDEVSGLTGLSVEQVVARHVAARYTVAFTGFAPGFAYLAGGDPALVVPRRDTPRPRIPAGAVGLAGSFSGVYPRESPGGWRLIGRTDRAMWDLDREPPAALLPGAPVRFEPRRERIAAAREPAASLPSGGQAEGAPVLEIEDPGLQALVQDAGRAGHARLGVSASGAADRGALERANRMVGNAGRAAALELGPGGFSAAALATAVLALAGAPRPGCIEGPLGRRAAPMDRPFRIDAGERLRLEGPERGIRTVLAVRGGVRAPLVLGSASRDTLAGLGPEPLAAGDRVFAGEAPRSAVGVPEPGPALPAPGEGAELAVVPGPREDWFGEEGLRRLAATSWEVTPRSDRVGVRLAGEPLPRVAERRDRELPSEGMAAGALQVPPDGQPVLFLADHPLTGGYPVIGVLRRADLDLAAQLPPGARVRFTIAKEED